MLYPCGFRANALLWDWDAHSARGRRKRAVEKTQSLIPRQGAGARDLVAFDKLAKQTVVAAE